MSDLVTQGAGPAAAKAVALVLHGRGQAPDYMLDNLVRRLSVEGVRYVLPASKGEGWYDAKAVETLTEDTETQLRAALKVVADAEAAARADCPDCPVVLIGFSQGACLVIEHLMRGGLADAAAMLTGCRVGAASEDLPRAELPGLPIYCSNGDEDPWIPAWAFQDAVSDLVACGARVRSDVLPGRDHEISALEASVVDALLSDVVRGTTVFGGAQ
ncbi:phospholipase/carboxylesterase [Roseivivax halotolerans]|uniref:Phospholipase/carboxylesterase n=1 Tax=Roseivivax halotolerans TaxID=93684 RepID=A0A1I5XFC1_9RHOB|nr:dienelactone hydrolase family protein [Roseivivax halotolerans]SFQ30661.1 phospholipase/carboxylesterase [Roseivivax halotolerans]